MIKGNESDVGDIVFKGIRLWQFKLFFFIVENKIISKQKNQVEILSRKKDIKKITTR